MSPNILEVMSFRMSTRVTATVVCCILMQILCVVSQKSFSFWGTSSPRLPTGAPPWTPLGDSPNNPVWSTPLEVWTNATKLTIMIVTSSFRKGKKIWSEKVRGSSKIKPRLRADWVVLIEELCILATCCFLSPMSKNSVLEKFKFKRLAVIREEICYREIL